MISAEFQPSIFSQAPVTITDDPYVLLELWAKDHSNINNSYCKNWNKSDDDIFERHLYGADIIGLHGGRSLTSATLTKDITIPESGTYWTLIRAFKCPETSSKNIGLSIDGDSKGRIDSYSPWHYYRFLDYGFLDLTSGSHTFTVELNGKDAWVDNIILYKMDYYSSEERKSSRRLDWSEIEFTENAMGELNAAEITLPLREEWNDPNRNIYSRKVFDYSDHLNIIVGSDWKDARVKFGGYLIGWGESDDGSQITFNGVDRLVDLYDRPSYTNYYIGVAPSGENTTFPCLQFGSAFEAIRHASETCEYGPLNYGISYPYTLYKDFRTLDDFNSVITSGFTKTFSPSTGLRLGYDKLNPDHCGITPDLNCSGILYDSPGMSIDAATDELLCLKYLAAGESCGQNTRVQTNIEVSMYKDGQTPDDVVVYTILFTGKAGATNIIGQITPVLNGIEQLAKFDWKAAFDNYAPSSHYYITKIEVVDVATSAQMERRQKSTINFLSIMSYDQDLNTKLELEQETSYPHENIQAILEKMEYVAWVDYGRHRALDVLCVAPEMYIPSPITAVEGVNVLEVTDKEYAPRDTLKNRRLSHYHYTEGDSDKTGVSFVENSDSVVRYGPAAKEEYEDMTGTDNLTDANIENTRLVKKNSYPMESFTLVMRGTPLLNPSQYIPSKLYGKYLVGDYSTKTVTHKINRDESYTSYISVNRPGSYYDLMMDKLEKKIKEYTNIKSRATYSQNVMNNMGFSSVGTFIRSGY
jgi:hypothetical protein